MYVMKWMCIPRIPVPYQIANVVRGVWTQELEHAVLVVHLGLALAVVCTDRGAVRWGYRGMGMGTQNEDIAGSRRTWGGDLL